MKTKYKVKVIDQFGEQIKYKLIVESNEEYTSTYTLKYTNNDLSLFPEFRGKTVMSVEDTGNGMIIKKHDGEEFHLDHSQFQELFIIMMAENDSHTNAVIKIKEVCS